jgi:hypothetical protein
MKIKGRVQFHKAPPWVRFELFSQAYQKHPFSVCSGGASYMIIRPTRAVAQTFFLAPAQMVVQKSLFAAQKSFFNNSTASAPLQIQNSPFRLRQLNLRAFRLVKNWTRKDLNSRSEHPFPPSWGKCFWNNCLGR